MIKLLVLLFKQRKAIDVKKIYDVLKSKFFHMMTPFNVFLSSWLKRNERIDVYE